MHRLNQLLSRLPLHLKLVLVGLLPFVFLVVLGLKLFQQNNAKLEMIESFTNRLNQSTDIINLIDELRMERRMSFQRVLRQSPVAGLETRRERTDSIIRRLSAYDDLHPEFAKYTFLENLQQVRQAVDSSQVNPGFVMDYYTNVLYRFNTLNQLPTGGEAYLGPVFDDLSMQKGLSDMVTYMGIISANIYNALLTNKFMIEILVGTQGVYQFYKSFETEFLLKSSGAPRDSFQAMRASALHVKVNDYIDRLFTTYKFDSTYNHEDWLKESFQVIDEMRALQQSMMKRSVEQIGRIHDRQVATNRNTLIALVLLLAMVVTLIIFVLRNISTMLRDLEFAAGKISRGEADVIVPNYSKDAIGSLANSISIIHKNEKVLAAAAHAIGNGNFDVELRQRSEHDVLGNALSKMKGNLQQLITELKNVQRELDDLNKDLEDKVVVRTQQLEAANRELESFSYSVSHDLRAPLRAVIGYSAILEEDYAPALDDEARRLVGVIKSNTIRMGQLIDDLLTFSRMSRQEIAKSSFDTGKLVQEAIKELHPKDRTQWKIGELPQTFGDANTLRQVWINLLSNAVKFSGRTETPVIRVGSYSQNGETVFYVKDNGAGFDEKYRDKLFKVFQRLHHQKDFEGTGIGLAIVEKIVSKHQGRVWAESKPGEGASFYFSLPDH